MPRSDVEIFFSTTAPAFAYPVGAEISAQASAVSAFQESNSIQVPVSGAAISGFPGNLNQFDLKTYPLLGTVRISEPNYTQSGTLAENDRKAISLMDIVLLGGFFGSAQDSATPGPNYISRTDVTQEILDAHQAAFGNDDIYVCTYLIQMSTNQTGEFGDKCFAETGPNGTDWWYRDSTGDIVVASGESPGSGGFVNLSDQITRDAQGRNYPDYYNEIRVRGEFLQVHADAGIGVGKGGINPWFDNFGIFMRKSGIDPDQDGQNDDMQDYYDPDNATHVATEPKAVQFVGEYRKNQRAGIEGSEAVFPGMLMGGNTNQWYQSYSGPSSALLTSEHPYVMKQYRLDENNLASKAFANLGLTENINWRPTELKDGYMRSHTLWTGVSSENGGNWQLAYNSIAFPPWNLSEPALHFGEWIIDCLDSGTDGPGGRRIYPAIPRSGSAWNAHRWAMASCMLCGSHYCPSGVIDKPTNTEGERRATPLFDEMGLINGSTDYGFGAGNTKLFYKWMGAAKDPVQTAVRMGTYIWMREFENCLVVINTNWDDTDPDETVIVANLPGGADEWTRIIGTQDTSVNNGTDVSSNFSLPSIDARFFPRKSWYDAL